MNKVAIRVLNSKFNKENPSLKRITKSGTTNGKRSVY